MKYLKVLAAAILTIATFGAAQAQVHHPRHHRHYHHKVVRHHHVRHHH